MQCGLPTLGRLHSWAAILLLLILGGQPASGAEDRELIAVLDLKGVRADEAETLALSDRLREEMLKSGQFILVDRSQMEALLDEQAFQQSGCTEQECAVQVGQILGVRKIVAGKVIRVSGDVWLVSGIMVDVESAQTIRAESVSHEGRFIDLMQGGVAGLA
jgi:TolB-like protein